MERLYSRNSLHNFPKEIRNYLLQDEYLNFDINNSKLSILFNFAEKNSLDVPILTSLVLQKDVTLNAYSDELGFSEEEVEELVNVTIDSADGSIHSFLFPNLFSEISLIRKTLMYSHAIGAPQGPKRDEKWLVPDVSPYDCKLAHVMQDLYCQAEETTQILKLIKFLKDKHVYQLLIPTNSDDFGMIDEKTGLLGEHKLSIIPFFDSIYVSSSVESFQSNIGSYINQFNEHK